VTPLEYWEVVYVEESLAAARSASSWRAYLILLEAHISWRMDLLRETGTA
jgi:hypothetical protein